MNETIQVTNEEIKREWESSGERNSISLKVGRNKGLKKGVPSSKAKKSLHR